MTEKLMNIWKHVDRIGDDDLADAIESRQEDTILK